MGVNPNIINHFNTAYDNNVIHQYQQKAQRLRGTVRHKMVKDADKLVFRRQGKAEAQSRASGAPVTHANPDKPIATVIPDESHIADLIDRKDARRIGYDDVDIMAMTAAFGLARKADKKIITAAYAAAGGTHAVLDLSGADTHIGHLLQIETILEDLDVPADGMMSFVCSPAVFNSFMLYKEFSSSDYVGVENYVFNSRERLIGRNWNGLYVIKHTGLSKNQGGTTGTVDCLLYHQSAIGHGALMEIDTRVTETDASGVPGWQVASYIDDGAVVIDDSGVLTVRMKNALTAF